MADYRVSRAAQADIASILGWSNEQFGEEARQRYEKLIVAAIRDAARTPDNVGHLARPELGRCVFFWHLCRSRATSTGGRVRQPRHFLLCRRDDDLLVVGRVLHEAMDPQRHLQAERTWE
ncbi:type II toxin-antitoxin system RelE/ParE family toxin [Arthrobacter sp. JSM 101049]|uniref:type II toxin-antitoxin system RelE/ParE family toxin n=1 Tax=Arthrobacter sp. JSM 101049 TaxID=929097 RepID=UPI0035657BCB